MEAEPGTYVKAVDSSEVKELVSSCGLAAGRARTGLASSKAARVVKRVILSTVDVDLAVLLAV